MELTDIIKEENLVLQKSKLLTDNVMHYCPGCTHGVVHKLIAEVIEELNITVPVALHLDHGTYEGCYKCIDAGFSSILP